MCPSTYLRGSRQKAKLSIAHVHVDGMAKILQDVNVNGLSIPYNNLAKKWITSARRAGIYIQFVPTIKRGVAPRFDIPISCK